MDVKEKPYRWTRKAPDKPGKWAATNEPGGPWDALEVTQRDIDEEVCTTGSGCWTFFCPIPEPLPPEEEPKQESAQPETFAEAITAAIEESRNYKPCMSLEVSEEGKAVSLYLDTAANTYSEWISGEGGDIGLMRCQETKKVMGVNLPLYRNNLALFHKGPLRINAGFRKDEHPAKRPWRSDPPDVPGKWEWRYPPHPGSSTYRAADLAAINGKWNSTLEYRLIEALPEPKQHSLPKPLVDAIYRSCCCQPTPEQAAKESCACTAARLVEQLEEWAKSEINAALLAKRSEP